MGNRQPIMVSSAMIRLTLPRNLWPERDAFRNLWIEPEKPMIQRESVLHIRTAFGRYRAQWCNTGATRACAIPERLMAYAGRLASWVALCGTLGLTGCVPPTTVEQGSGAGKPVAADLSATAHALPLSAVERLTQAHPQHPVSLLLVHTEASMQLTLNKTRKLTLHSPEDLVLQSKALTRHSTLQDSDWVFVGYGIQVPALGWDSYQGHDLKGKTVIILSGAPPLKDGLTVNSQEALAHPVVRGWGDWHGKLENAHRHGAALALLVHDAQQDGLDEATLKTFQNAIVSAQAGATDPLGPWGWISEKHLQDWLKRAGVPWSRVRQKADASTFEPIELPLRANVQLNNQWTAQDIMVPDQP